MPAGPFVNPYTPAQEQAEDAYKSALGHAASLAGLNIIRFVKEPIAAAMAYGLDGPEDSYEEKTVLVYDCGGNSLTVTLMIVEQGVFEVIASERAEIDVGELLTNLGGMDRNMTMTRKDFEVQNHFLVQGTLGILRKVLLAANVTWDKLDDVIVVGGSGKIPMVRRTVERHLARENQTVTDGAVDPAEAMVYGAVVTAMVSED